MNQFLQVRNRHAQCTRELHGIENDEEPETIRTPEGTFNNEEWVAAEYEATAKKIGDLQMIVTPNGTVDY